MKKLTSLFLAGMVATVGCVSAIGSVSADTDDVCVVSLVKDSEGAGVSAPLHKGDKIEFTVTGYSEKAITGAVVATYINQEELDGTVEYTDKEFLRYADGYYTDGEETSFYKAGFEGYQVRPESADEFDRDKFGYCYVLGRPSGDYENGQFMYSFAVEVVSEGSCWVNTVLEDVTFDNEAGEPESDLSVLNLKTEMKIDYAGEEPTDAPTDEPTDAPTDEPTDEPTETPSEVVTDTPTSATNAQPTDVSTEKETSTTSVTPTNATNSNNTNTNNNSGNTNSSSTSSGKVATGSNSAVMVVGLGMISAMLVVGALRKRKNSK